MATDAAPSLTEQHNPRSADMDALCAADLVRLFAEEDRRAVEATVAVADDTARAVEWAASSMRAGGRLLYVGAGTSGRLGVLDASECPPTFGVDASTVVGIIAGGDGALRTSAEGAEDDAAAGVAAIAERDVSARDVVLGIAASGRTLYVLGALREARRRSARSVLLSCTPPHGDVRAYIDLFITQDRATCLVCHESMVGMPEGFKQINVAEHLEDMGAEEVKGRDVCFECHMGHDTAP